MVAVRVNGSAQSQQPSRMDQAPGEGASDGVTMSGSTFGSRQPRSRHWWRGFRDEEHRRKFLAAGAPYCKPFSMRPQCIAIAKATGRKCRGPAISGKSYCYQHDETWRPKDPATPRRLRAKAIRAAKRHNARIYAAVDADLALMHLTPSEYDALRRQMVEPRLWWVPPLDEWIRKGMPWPPELPRVTKESQTENQGRSSE